MLTAAGSQPDSQITAPVDCTPKYPRSSEAQTGCLILSFLSCRIGKPGLRKTSHYFDHSVQISEHKEEIGIFISFLKSQTQPCVHTRWDTTLVCLFPSGIFVYRHTGSAGRSSCPGTNSPWSSPRRQQM